MPISGTTRVCGLIGDPIDHTLSPAMHNAAFHALKLDFVYVPFRVAKNELRDAIKGARSLNVCGLNVTMPHKIAVVAYLDELDSIAKSVGSVNTIHNKRGKLVGYNTDGVGALKAFEENGVFLDDQNLVLIGAGGTARAIAFAAAHKVRTLTILNRNLRKAEELAKALRRYFGVPITLRQLSANTLQTELKDATVLINATPIGMHPNVNQSLVDPSWLTPQLTIMDVVYNPVETQLLKTGRTAGAKIISGIEMLIHQGAIAFEIWTGHNAPVGVMRKTILHHLRDRVEG